MTSIPPDGPLPPGAGYQQVETPGSPYPYVYIGGGGGTRPNGIDYIVPGTAFVDDASFPGWKNQNPPGGSYQQSCRQITSDGQGNVSAQCDNGTGVFIPSSLNYSGCDRGAVFNKFGQLMCYGPNGVVSVAAGTSSTPVSPVTPLPPSYSPIGGGSSLNIAPRFNAGSGASFSTQLSNFFRSYGLYIGLGLAAYLFFFRKGGKGL